MSLALACPRCQARFEVADELAGQTVACRQCSYALETPAKETVPPPRFRPRSPFPLRSLVILGIGVLLLLLVISAGFNIWYVLGYSSDHRYRSMEEINAIEKKAAQAEQVAGQVATTARRELADAQRQLDVLKQQNQDLKRQLDFLKEQRTQDPE